MKRRRTPQQSARRSELADAAAGWEPKRGDLVHDKDSDRTGVVVALPQDNEADVYHLRPAGGGTGWPARLAALSPRGDVVDDQGMSTDQAAMPPDGIVP